MKLLLDTHILIWVLENSEKLKNKVANCICDPQNQVYVSTASIWEIEIKKGKGKLESPSNILDMLARKRFDELPISHRHVIAINQLPNVHRDPFDRILAAQAKVDALTLVTQDSKLVDYGVRVMFN